MASVGSHSRVKIMDSFHQEISNLSYFNNEGFTKCRGVLSNPPKANRKACGDIIFSKEKSERAGGFNTGNSGVLTRILMIEITVAAFEASFSYEEFEGFIGDIERAVAVSDEISKVADEWHLSDTTWDYVQDESMPVKLCNLVYRVSYQTEVEDPGVAN